MIKETPEYKTKKMKEFYDEFRMFSDLGWDHYRIDLKNAIELYKIYRSK